MYTLSSTDGWTDTGACEVTLGDLTVLNTKYFVYVPTYVANFQILGLRDLKLGKLKQIERRNNFGNVKNPDQ